MKKLGTVKKCGYTLITLFVCLAIAISYLVFGVKTAPAPSAETVTDSAIFEGISVPEKCDYGKSFKVSAVDGKVVTVTRPDGTDEPLGTATDGKYTITAKQVGNYTVKYANEGDNAASYSFNVHVTLDEEYFLKVDFNGADIPSNIQKGGTFKIPGAKVVYYDENNILRSYNGKVALSITASKNKDGGDNKYNVGDTFTASNNGKVYLTYTAVVGEDGSKQFSKTFTVNVQSKLSDTVAPSLVITGVSNTVSVNRAVTLPVATATDSYDDNVKVEITVTDKDGKRVRVVDVNKDGYASQDPDKLAADEKAEAENTENYTPNYPYVEFDNDKAMTFYPVKPGQYTVTYVATDDAGNKSSERSYPITASDLAAPVFKSIDDHLIPDTWGYKTVKNAEGDVADVAGKVTFPIPTLVDNKDRVPTADDESEDLISLYFRITDSDNAKTVFEITNVFAADANGEFKANDTYGEKDKAYRFENGKLVFDFNLYNKKDSKGEESDLAGTYTVLYRAKDKAGNTSSKSYTITLQEDYVDDTAPSTVEVDVPSYIAVADDDTTMTIPSPVVADANDSRPEVVYGIYTDAENNIAVEGGETAKFERRADGLYLVIEDEDKELKLGDVMYFYLSVKDKAGNVKRNTEGNVDDFTKSEAKVKIISSATTDAYAYTGAIEFKAQDGEKIEEDSYVTAGGFKIHTTQAMCSYTGFEVQALSPDGDIYDLTLDTFFTLGEGGADIYVRNITFAPSVAGVNRLIVRIFDVNGVNSVYSYDVTVAESVVGGGNTVRPSNSSVSTIAPSGNLVNVRYKLRNEVINVPSNEDSTKTYYAARQISGGAFSLMGAEIVAKTQGTYTVYDAYISEDKLNVDTFKFEDATYSDHYTFQVVNNSAPVIEVQGELPAYEAKGATVVLPSVFGYSEYGNAEIDIKVTHKDKPVTTKYDEATNSYSFVGANDGAYTVVYTATYANAKPVTFTHTINVGDVEGPEFEYEGGTQGRQTAGATFEFGTLKLTDSEESESGITITKKLYDPSKEEVSEATVSGSYRTYKDKKNNDTEIKLDKSGDYEVVYTVTDSVGNSTELRYTITVVRAGSSTPTTFTTVSTVLIIVAVVLLAGVIVYVVRFRKVKK